MESAKSNVEIMAPVGSYETLNTAIKAGADSVYFGVGGLNMRAKAGNNFALEDLSKIVKLCEENNVWTYLTVNAVYYDSDIEDVRKLCDAAKEAGVTAVIAMDFAAIQYARSIGLRVHLSTQANVSNIEAVNFYSQFADVIVLARELTLEQIGLIYRQIREQNICGPSGELVKVEVFVHGALCVSISGKCYMSLATYNQSANRGQCLQNCRRAYKVVDEETGDELVLDNKYVMSPKDLCTIGIVDKLIDAGATVFKIEGRARKADYVYTVVKSYKEAAASVAEGTYTEEKIERWTQDLRKVYNRGFWQGGHYLGKKLGEWSGAYGSQSTTEKVYVGKGLNYYSEKGIALFMLEAEELKLGDDIIVTGPTTGIVEHKLTQMKVDDKDSDVAKKGDEVTFPLPEKIRHKDKLFVIKERTSSQG
jgi:putative protease